MNETFPNQVPIHLMTREQVLVLASAPCSEVFSMLGSAEALSAREVAAAIDRSPASVSEQIAKLVEVGLVIPAGTRKRRSRTEALFVHKGVVTRFILKDQPKDVLEAYQRRMAAHLRLAERRFSAFQDVFLHDQSYQDFLIYKTTTAQLSREGALRVQLAIAEVLELIRSLDQPDAEARAQGDFIRLNFTALMLPTQQESARRMPKENSKKKV
jgi:hypothetical protein